MLRPVVTFWTISANTRKQNCLCEASYCAQTEKRPTIMKISSPRGQMWRCALSAVTRSPSPPWLLLDIRPGCWSHSPAGDTAQTARCCTKSSLSRVMEIWAMGDWIHTNIYSNKNSNKTHTLVFSFCHEGAIKKLHHGVLLFVLCTSESGKGFCFYVTKRRKKSSVCAPDRFSAQLTFHWQPAETHPRASRAVCGKTRWHPDNKKNEIQIKTNATKVKISPV